MKHLCRCLLALAWLAGGVGLAHAHTSRCIPPAEFKAKLDPQPQRWTVMSGEDSDAFVRAFNRLRPVSHYRADTVIWGHHRVLPYTLIAFFDNECLVTAGRWHKALFMQLLHFARGTDV